MRPEGGGISAVPERHPRFPQIQQRLGPGGRQFPALLPVGSVVQGDILNLFEPLVAVFVKW